MFDQSSSACCRVDAMPVARTACDRSRETTTSVPSRPPSFREPRFIGTPDRILEIVSILTFTGGNAMRPGAGCGGFREQSLLPRRDGRAEGSGRGVHEGMN